MSFCHHALEHNEATKQENHALATATVLLLSFPQELALTVNGLQRQETFVLILCCITSLTHLFVHLADGAQVRGSQTTSNGGLQSESGVAHDDGRWTSVCLPPKPMN